MKPEKSASTAPWERVVLAGRGWIWLLASAVAGSLVILTQLRWVIPVFQAALAWPILLAELRRGRPWRACWLMLAWAFFLSVGTIEITIHAPQAAEAGILKGAQYREEMFHFIRTGVGAEGSPAQFLPQHLLHYLLTLGSSFLTAGFAGLLLGAILLNYMNFYVGALVLEGARPVLGSFVGWPIWPVVRVVAFVFGAIALAHFSLGRVLGRAPYDRAAFRRMLTWSVILFLADIVIKALLAPHWRKLLLRALLP